MRVLLVPSFNFVGGLFEPYVPYGVMSLQAASSAIKGVTVDVCQFTDHLLAHRFQSSNDLAEYVFTSNNVETYDVVGLSIVCNALHHAVTLANFIRAKCKNMTIIAGGPFVTKLASRFLAAFEAFDGVFVGEAETSFVEFLRRNNDRTSIDYQIPGLTTRRWLSVHRRS
jgi:anaerobic magnesium-protoporphyrin IX monomethyl ester cyclase